MSPSDAQPRAISVDRRGPVAVVEMARPQARNALDHTLRRELADAFEELDADSGVRCIILMGAQKVFAAGADLNDLVGASPVDLLRGPMQSWWSRLSAVRTPIIAAVRGFALGGGCELALTCDMVVAGEGAQFGLPEIGVGIMPGGGGTQRLVRTVGRARAAEIVMTGRRLTAQEAHRLGLVSRLVADDDVIDEAGRLAAEVASKPAIAVMLIKDAIRMAHETTLESGIRYERRNLELLFSTDDQREGMRAFLDKRAPNFNESPAK